MNYADEIKNAVSMKDVCDMYGIEVNRGGFAKCVWHNDNKPSMKVYDGSRGCHCFACGSGGDVTDFVMQLFRLPFRDAQAKLNTDFHLGLPLDGKLSYEEKRKAEYEAAKRRAERDRMAREREKAESEYHDALDRYIALERVVRGQKPATPDGISEEYASAIREVDKAKYRLECAETKLYTLDHKEVDNPSAK